MYGSPEPQEFVVFDRPGVAVSFGNLARPALSHRSTVRSRAWVA
jgi:hypothetical protein